ncbi:hypothetical protein V1514DRAFT_334692 [Lipomyces japonicus]|uniref:uncharacterized protein n=1 Tax=Lipomyces japonicus TaxID=56871 RepID=UPI0034CF4F3D
MFKQADSQIDLLIKALREYYKIFPIWFRPVLMLTLAQFELWAFLMFGHAGLAILEQGWLYLIFKIYICGFTTFFERRRFLAVLFGVLLVLLVQNATGAVATATYVQAWRAVGRSTSQLAKYAMYCLTEVGKIAIALFIAYVVKAPVAQMTTTTTTTATATGFGLQVVTATTTGPIRPVPAFYAFSTTRTTKITGNEEPRVTETGLQVYGYGPDMTTDLTVVYCDMPQCQCPATYDVRTTDLTVLTETGRSKETGLSVIVISMRMIPGPHWAPRRTLTVSDVSSGITTSALPLPSPLPRPMLMPMPMPMKLPEYVKYAIGNVQCVHMALLNLVLDMDWQFVLSLARRMHPLGGAGRGG